MKRKHIAERDPLGDRMKRYEEATSSSAMKGLPLLARLDGIAFHTFTRGLRRPYDTRLQDLMVKVTETLVETLHATIGYTQSDEIQILWMPKDENHEFLHDGRFQKICSRSASIASREFNLLLPGMIPEKQGQSAIFDCRVWQVPSKKVVYETFLWRELDATRNSVSMAAQSMFSHKELQGKSRREMMDMMHLRGINWNDYPRAFKRGTYVRKRLIEKELSAEELSKIPPKYRPTGPVIRSEVVSIDMPILSTVINAEDVLCFGQDPMVRASDTGESNANSDKTGDSGKVVPT